MLLAGSKCQDLALTFCLDNQQGVMWVLACLCVMLSVLEEGSGMCPSQCSCDALGRDDGTESRVVLCNDPDMTDVPTDIPVGTVKLRIEKTVIRRIPAEAFYDLVELQYLWVTYNSVASVDTSSFYNLQRLHELRLDGNGLEAFPWASLHNMPLLRSLALHNNRISSIPEGAAPYLQHLTYLDLSSNRLATLPPDFLESWSHLVTTPSRSPGPSPGRVVLGLQDNPWRCDCHISRIIELSKATHPALVLLDPLMTCSGPEHLAGILFRRAELEQCLKPSLKISATQITSAPGSNVLLRCDATGSPTPRLTWTRANSSPVNHTVIQESPVEGVRWSVISLAGISHQDAGDYKCRAQNLAGTSEAVVVVKVVDATTTTLSADTQERIGGGSEAEVRRGSRSPLQAVSTSTSPWPLASMSFSSSTSLSPFSQSPPSSVAFSLLPIFSAIVSSNTALSPGTPAGPGGKRKATSELGGKKPFASSASRVDELMSLHRATPMAVGAMVKNLRVVGQTRQSVTLTWDPGNATWTSEVTVLYSRHGDEELRPLNADTNTNQVTITGLEAGQQYMACICPKGAPPQTHQCISFSMEGGHEGSGPQDSVVVLASGTACVVVLPLIFFLLYKVCKLRCSPDYLREDDLAEETYVQFESLSPGVQSQGELWPRRGRDDCERLLLCSRSSRESPMTFQSEASRPEWHC